MTQATSRETVASRENAPIVIFAYNRADHLARMLKSLIACHGFADSEVTIRVDGPRSPSDEGGVAGVRQLVTELQLPNVTYSFAKSNKGLRRSIFEGVSAICKTKGRVIVLEDDLVLSRTALSYFNAALERYKECTDVWSIVGYSYDAPALRDKGSALILPFAHPWGWATWSRAWSQFALDARPSDANLRAESFRTAFDMNGLYPFSTLLEKSINGEVSSWFIHWYYTVFKSGGRSIFPSHRLVDNRGMGKGGTHGSRLNPYDRLVTRPPLFEGEVSFGTTEEVDHWALDLMRDARELRVQRLIAAAGYLKRRFRNPSRQRGP